MHILRHKSFAQFSQLYNEVGEHLPWIGQAVTTLDETIHSVELPNGIYWVLDVDNVVFWLTKYKVESSVVTLADLWGMLDRLTPISTSIDLLAWPAWIGQRIENWLSHPESVLLETA